MKQKRVLFGLLFLSVFLFTILSINVVSAVDSSNFTINQPVVNGFLKGSAINVSVQASSNLSDGVGAVTNYTGLFVYFSSPSVRNTSEIQVLTFTLNDTD